MTMPAFHRAIATAAWRALRIVVATALLVAVDSATSAVEAPQPLEAPHTAGRISVGRAATVDGATVRLADVAVLEGNASTFADVELGPAPDPGGSRRVDGITILRKLRAAGLDDAATRYEIPAAVRVARAYQDVGADELRAAAERDVPRLLAPGEQLRALEVGGGVRIPPGAYELRLAASPSAATRGGSRRRADIEVVQDGGVVATVTARLDVVASGPVVLLRHAVARGTVLTRADVTLEERELGAGSGGVVTTLADAIGKETRVALPAGAPLTLTAVSSPLLVRRGELVTVVVETPGMRLSTPGEALEPGAAGAEIRVRNRKSQQELSAQVVERGTVLVRY